MHNPIKLIRISYFSICHEQDTLYAFRKKIKTFILKVQLNDIKTL